MILKICFLERFWRFVVWLYYGKSSFWIN